MDLPIYLDYHATTPVDPLVLEGMLPYFNQYYGNPSSRSHSYGWQASEGVESAREQLAALLQVNSKDIFFTSGATEGINMLIKGTAESKSRMGKHIITVSTEHPAVLDSVSWLKKKGYEITLLPVNSDGRLQLEKLSEAIRKDTILVIVMWANNETGVLQDMKAIGAICNHAGVVLMSDATQAVGKIPVDPIGNGVHMLSLSAHKMYGPKGIGAVYLNQQKLKVKPGALLHGGGHERGFRSGTLNVPGIVGLGIACKLRLHALDKNDPHIEKLRDHFEKVMIDSIEQCTVNGHLGMRLPTVSNLQIKYVDSQAVISRFRNRLAISSGSACSSAHPEPSHVLQAMGLSETASKSSFRISLGTPTTTGELTKASQLMIQAIEEERAQSPVWQMFKQGIDLSDEAM